MWSFQVYGKYDRPYGSCKNMVQPSIREAFNKPDVKPLDFPIGFGFKRILWDLILEKQKAPPVAVAVEAKP